MSDRDDQSGDLGQRVSEARSALDLFRQCKVDELSLASQIDDQLQVVEVFLQGKTLRPDEPAYQAMCTFTVDYARQVRDLAERSESNQALISAGSYIAAGAVSCMAETDYGIASGLLSEIDGIRSARSIRQDVTAALRKHNHTLADIYASAWEALYASAADPARGPAFLMREVLTQFLHHFAPDEGVRAQSWWKPYDEKKGISRADRIKFIYHNAIPDYFRIPVVWNQLNAVRRLIDVLNKAHPHGPLDVEYVRPKLNEAQELLQGILAAVPPPLQ